MSGRSGTALYSNAFHAPIIRRHPRPGSNLTGHAESGLRATGDAFPLVPDVDENLIGTQKEPGLKDRARGRGAVLLVPAIWAALDRPSSLPPVPPVIRHCDELPRAAGLLGHGVDRVTHRPRVWSRRLGMPGSTRDSDRVRGDASGPRNMATVADGVRSATPRARGVATPALAAAGSRPLAAQAVRRRVRRCVSVDQR
jgi:hypothetical protein